MSSKNEKRAGENLSEIQVALYVENEQYYIHPQDFLESDGIKFKNWSTDPSLLKVFNDVEKF